MDVWLKNDSEKVCNSFTWFSHGSGAILAPEPLGRVPFSTTRVFETWFLWTKSMRRGRDPSRTPSRPRRPVFDNPREQLPGTGIRSDAENLYSGNLYGGSAQGVSGNSSGGVAVTEESSSGGCSLPVNVLGNGSGGASTSGQASVCAGEERPSLFSDSGNRLPLFNPFAVAMTTLGPAERYESQYMGANEFLNRRLNEEFQRAFLQSIHLLRYIILELQVIVPHQKVFEVLYLMGLHQFHLIQHHLQFRLGLRPQFSLQVQHLRDCRALQEGCLMLEVL